MRRVPAGVAVLSVACRWPWRPVGRTTSRTRAVPTAWCRASCAPSPTPTPSHDDKLELPKAYPDVEVRTATFESNDEAAAKIKAGFRTDVIEVCLDESGPPGRQRPARPDRHQQDYNWDDMAPAFRDADGVTIDGPTYLVPTSAGPHGLIYDKDDLPRRRRQLGRPLRPGRTTAGGPGRRLLAHTVRRHGTGHGNTDPMTLDDEEIAEVRDYMIDDPRAVPHVRRQRLRHHQPVQVRRGRPERRRAGTTAETSEGRRDVGWVAPEGGRTLLGLRVWHQLPTARTSTPSYALINHYLSAEMQASSRNKASPSSTRKPCPWSPRRARRSRPGPTGSR